jgi:hypothetical protein
MYKLLAGAMLVSLFHEILLSEQSSEKKKLIQIFGVTFLHGRLFLK